jgi:hypothetical protein
MVESPFLAEPAVVGADEGEQTFLVLDECGHRVHFTGKHRAGFDVLLVHPLQAGIAMECLRRHLHPVHLGAALVETLQPDVQHAGRGDPDLAVDESHRVLAGRNLPRADVQRILAVLDDMAHLEGPAILRRQVPRIRVWLLVDVSVAVEDRAAVLLHESAPGYEQCRGRWRQCAVAVRLRTTSIFAR